jgi:hypothetical protein
LSACARGKASQTEIPDKKITGISWHDLEIHSTPWYSPVKDDEMNPDKKKSYSKIELFWNHFEKSGSIQAYLRFHEATQKGLKVKAKTEVTAKSSSKKLVKNR